MQVTSTYRFARISAYTRNWMRLKARMTLCLSGRSPQNGSSCANSGLHWRAANMRTSMAVNGSAGYGVNWQPFAETSTYRISMLPFCRVLTGI